MLGSTYNATIRVGIGTVIVGIVIGIGGIETATAETAGMMNH